MSRFDNGFVVLEENEQRAFGVSEERLSFGSVGGSGAYSVYTRYNALSQQQGELKNDPIGYADVLAILGAPDSRGQEITDLEDRKDLIVAVGAMVMIYELEEALGISHGPTTGNG